MKLHPKLKAFEGRKNISKMSKILTALEKDLASVQQTHLSVEIIEEQDERSTMDKFLEIRRCLHIDRIMEVRTRIMDRDVLIVVPMHQHQVFPYSIEINLNVDACGTAIYEQGFAKKRWVVDPKDEKLERQLKRLKLPKITWSYQDRGLKHTIQVAFVLGARDDGTSNAIWTINSGYFAASFLGGKLAKTSCFVEAIPELESVLAAHWH